MVNLPPNIRNLFQKFNLLFPKKKVKFTNTKQKKGNNMLKNTGKNITYLITQMSNAIAFQIEEQTSNLTNFLLSKTSFLASNGWRVAVDEEPEVNVAKKVIFLRGRDTAQDNKIATAQNLNLSEKELNRTVNSIIKAIEEVSVASMTSPSKIESKVTYLVNLDSLRGKRYLSFNPDIVIINE